MNIEEQEIIIKEITAEQALEAVRSLAFPFVEEEDTVEYEGFNFVYQQGQWEQSDGTN